MILLLLAALLCETARADTAAMLSSDSKPYREALEGLRTALGPNEEPTLVRAGEDPATDTLVAFGAKAAVAKHARAGRVIVALAPAYLPSENDGCVITIASMPSPKQLIATLRRVDPGMTRVWVPWVSASFQLYVKQLAAEGHAAGIGIENTRLATADDLPTQLRARETAPSAILVPPDPDLINRTSFAILKQITRANKKALYAPFPSLIVEGATASIGVTFREMGRAAGLQARLKDDEARCGTTAYPETLEVRVSLSAAAEAGLTRAAKDYSGLAEVVP